jgi:hypothetical protein
MLDLLSREKQRGSELQLSMKRKNHDGGDRGDAEEVDESLS